MKKIFHITESLAGGVLHCIALLANEQARAGSDVTVIHSVRVDTPEKLKLDAMFDSSVARRAIRMRTSIGLGDVYSLLKITAILIRQRPDVIHLHSSKAGALGRMAAFMLGMSQRTFYSPHGFSFLKTDVPASKALAFIRIERWLHALGATLIGCSKSETRYARLLLSRKRISTVENAVDLARWSNLTRWPRSPEVVVFCAARLTYQKAPWRFSQIASALREKSSRVRFIWLGDGDEALAKAWLDADDVELTGWIDPASMPERLAQYSVFVLPSLWEGMPISLIEAQAAGLPAVASRVPGNIDVIEHNVTGFLAANEAELIEYTRRLIEDEGLRARMSRAAIERSHARFGVDKFFQATAKVYGNASVEVISEA